MAGERTRARGELESAVMTVLWDNAEPLTAKEILDHIPGRTPAHTTLLTALDRLCRKGQVARLGDAPRGMRFQAVHSEAEHASQAMLETLGETQDRGAALLSFAGSLSTQDIELLMGAIDSRAQGRSKRVTKATKRRS